VPALCVSANNIPGTYAAALNMQIFGGWFARVTRAIWSTATVIVYTVTAIAGREMLFDIFLNFLSLIGYWVTIWIAIMAEDEFLFQRRLGTDYD
jgi:purine-cytosine permease-like protein